MEDDLKSIFSDFNPKASETHMVTLDEFLGFFAKVSRTIPNHTFNLLIQDLLA